MGILIGKGNGTIFGGKPETRGQKIQALKQVSTSKQQKTPKFYQSVSCEAFFRVGSMCTASSEFQYHPVSQKNGMPVTTRKQGSQHKKCRNGKPQKFLSATLDQKINHTATPPKFNIPVAPEKWWLEY